MVNLKYDDAKFSRKKGSYFIGSADGLADPTIHAFTQEYKRRLSSSMRAIAGEDISRIASSEGYYGTRKYDGEFGLIAFDGKELLALNPRGTVRGGLPCFEEAEQLLRKAKVKSCLLGGEIYLAGDEKKAWTRVHQVTRILRSPKSEEETGKLRLAIFDIAEFEGEPVTSTADIFALLDRWFGKGKLVHPVEYRVLKDLRAVKTLFNDWVLSEGSEGIVVRHDQVGWYKIKQRHDLDVAVIGYSEGVDDRKGMLHDLLVAVMRQDGTFHELARVGGGFSDEQRRSLASQLKRRVAKSDYVAVNNDYVAYEMIAPGPVVSMSCLDLISEGSKGDPINKMVLEWDGKAYKAVTRMPLASVISPQFIRERDDKEANVEDVNIRQLEAFINIEEAEKPASEEKAPESKLLEREVYTKVMKEQTMVRKLLLWKTNKDKTGRYPGFVVYLTDYSPNRKNPLERDIRVAKTERVARKWFKELAAQYFVGGWEKVSK